MLIMGKMLWLSFVKCHIISRFSRIYMSIYYGKSISFTQKSYIFQIMVKLYDTNWLKAYF